MRTSLWIAVGTIVMLGRAHAEPPSLDQSARYELGRIAFDRGQFRAAIEAFFDVARATRQDPRQTSLHRAATRDFVRTYAEIGSPDTALSAFRRVSRVNGIDMLDALAELYLDTGKFENAISVLRELMTQRPHSARVCTWQREIVRATQFTGTLARRVAEIENLVKVATTVGPSLPREAAHECQARTRRER